MTPEDPSMNIEVLRDAVDKLTQRLAMVETENAWLRREIESVRALHKREYKAYKDVQKWATGHL